MIISQLLSKKKRLWLRNIYSKMIDVKKLTVLKPPGPIEGIEDRFSVFLAGSIEMDRAVNWQASMAEKLADLPIILLNPRRDSWDASWEQSIENQIFREQVEWELYGLEQASLIVIYFDPSTKSPISLLELGLFAHSQRVVVCCPDRFWRKGNVDIVCQRYGVTMVDDLNGLIDAVRAHYLSWVAQKGERK